jgi:hypothetical protein
MNTWQGWEAAVLNAIGAPVTDANVAFLDAWNNAEQSGASYNPLNTTQPASGSWSYNSAGVQEYNSPAQGANAIAATLENGYYPNILTALRSGNPLDGNIASMEAELTTWGTGPGFLQSLLGGPPPSQTVGSNVTGNVPTQTVNNVPVSKQTVIAVATISVLIIGVAILAMQHRQQGAQA